MKKLTVVRNERALRIAERAQEAFQLGDMERGGNLLKQAGRIGRLPSFFYVSLVSLMLRQGNVPSAERALLEARASGETPPSESALWSGRIARAKGDIGSALAEFHRAAMIEPDFIDAWRELSFTAGQSGDLALAVDACRRCVALPEANGLDWSNLGRALAGIGDFAAAEQALDEAVLLAPDHAYPRSVVAWCALQQGRHEEAQAAIEAALARNPDDPSLWELAGTLAHNAGEPDVALGWYRRVSGRKPHDVGNLTNLAGSLVELDRIGEAAVHYREASRLSGDGLHALSAVLHVPAIPQALEEIAEIRSSFIPALEELQASGLRIADPLAAVTAVPFYLAYHGECNKDLHRHLASFYRAVAPDLAYCAPHCERYAGPAGRIRVGLVSAYLYDHSIGRTTRGFVARLDRKRFHVTAVFVGEPRDDELSRFIRARSDEAIVLPRGSLREARQKLADAKLDIIFYQDIGMEPTTYFLAHARLAPVQCYSFGHPDTTGIPTIDWFVSSQLFEPSGAAAHYSERLWQLPNAGTLSYYYKPQPVSPLEREVLGIPRAVPFYLCGQALFKLHPSFDLLLAGILERDPVGLVGLIHNARPALAARIRQRLQRTLGELAQRVIILPRVSSTDFHRLLAAADVVLDTTHFNGMNTSLEAFAQGKPVVTLPGTLQRGRHTSGMYAQMGLSDRIAVSADDYIERAVALGHSAELRQDFSEALTRCAGVLYENDATVRGFEAFFESALDEVAKRGGAGI